ADQYADFLTGFTQPIDESTTQESVGARDENWSRDGEARGRKKSLPVGIGSCGTWLQYSSDAPGLLRGNGRPRACRNRFIEVTHSTMDPRRGNQLTGRETEGVRGDGTQRTQGRAHRA